MAFDLVTWAIGYGASKGASSLIEKVFDNGTYRALRKAADEWASRLPEDICTSATALFDTESVADQLGDKKAKLKSLILDLHKIPSEEEWYDALIETWELKKMQLGTGGNAFFQQPRSSAENHLRALAASLFGACASVLKNSQPLLVREMRELSSTQGLILQEIRSFRSPLNNFTRDGRYPTRLNFDPTHIEEQQLHLLNEIACVDSPTEVVAGSLRTHEIWIGPEGCGKLEANYVPSEPAQIPRRLTQLLQQWNRIAVDLARRSTDAIIGTLANFHHRFLSIHPYPDGNGRVARVMLDLQVRNFTSCQTPLRLKARDEYYLALRAADEGSISQLTALLTSVIEKDDTPLSPQ